jgi:hypothetical protein
MVFAFVFLLATNPDDEKKRRMRGNRFGMGGVRDLSGYVCCHCPDVCEAFFKMKE